MKQDFAGRAGNKADGKITLIYNGYDQDDFIGLDHIKKHDKKFIITYLGTWGHLVTPEFFLRALGSLLRKKEHLRERIKVNFIGEVKFDTDLGARIEQIISQENLGLVVQRLPFVPHKRGLSHLYDSDVLLLVIGMDTDRPDASNWRVVAKLFEYLYVRKPILALVPPDGESARIIRETNSGEIVPPNDIDCIEEKIYEMYKRFENGNLTSHIRSIEKYDRRIQTGLLAGIFDKLAGVSKVSMSDIGTPIKRI
jgi:glycosyltransferase involved in cell wall biosynthesis